MVPHDTIDFMNAISVETPTDWTDYELLDSGDGEKLERFASYILIRPDPRALWNKNNPSIWKNADAAFKRTDSKTGQWIVKNPPPNPWITRYRDLAFTLRPTEFKHVGVFPEQAVNWNWISEQINGRQLNTLNLFAYTGGATLAAAKAGARVTHVDSVKSTITWAHENVINSGLEDKPIRWIEDDAFKFVLREAKRGNRYDGIIMDPPRFGRGTKGEVWKLEDDLPKLLSACKQILLPNPAFILVNAYTADISSIVIFNMLESIMKDHKGAITSGELAIPESKTGRLLPNGIFARWTAQ